MSQSQKQVAKSSAERPQSPKSKEQDKNSITNKSISSNKSSRKEGSSSSKFGSSSNKLLKPADNSSKSSTSRSEVPKSPRNSQDSGKTIDLTGSSPKETLSDSDRKAIVEEITKKDDFVRALQSRVFNREPVLAINPLRSATRQKCNTCKTVKPLHQTWQVHNTSPDHIEYMLNNEGSYSKVTERLQRNLIKELNIFCDLCGNWYPDIISFQAHQREAEHQNRTRDLANWRAASKNAGTNISDWKQVAKIKKVDSKTLSKAIRKSISKGK